MKLTAKLIEIATELNSGVIDEQEARYLLYGLLGVRGWSCPKCGMSDIDMKYLREGTEIHWSEHNEIKDIVFFTRNDRSYRSDVIKKECLVHTCKTCGYKKAASCI